MAKEGSRLVSVPLSGQPSFLFRPVSSAPNTRQLGSYLCTCTTTPKPAPACVWPKLPSSLGTRLTLSQPLQLARTRTDQGSPTCQVSPHGRQIRSLNPSQNTTGETASRLSKDREGFMIKKHGIMAGAFPLLPGLLGHAHSSTTEPLPSQHAAQTMCPVTPSPPPLAILDELPARGLRV